MTIRARLLEQPNIFALFTFLIGVSRRTKSIVSEYVRADSTTVVLDVACGRGNWSKSLYPSKYLGIDNNPAYIRYAKNRFGTFGSFICCDVADIRVHAANLEPNVVILIGVLHHLSNDQAISLLHDIHALLGTHGRVITVDPVFTADQGLTARLLAASDRGRFVRSINEHLALFDQRFSVPIADIRSDWLRIPYTHFVCVGHKIN